MESGRPAAILDVDGTLVDSVYHHALAWQRALRRNGVDVPMWRCHRHIGMGGDKIVGALAGEEWAREHGDDAREAEAELFAELIDEVRPLAGAHKLVDALKQRGHSVVLASSAKEEELEHYIDLVGARDLADAWTSSADVEATKPEPDLVQAALDRVPDRRAVMVGDATWDCKAAGRAGIPSVGVLTGGFGEQELHAAGAEAVFESLDDLRAGLDSTPLR